MPNTDKIGILDVDGINNNPLTDKPYSDKYKNLAKIWSKFPAYVDHEHIMKEIERNQVILVISGTGSGKTVLVPKFVLHVFNYDKKIAITLPKRIIAKSAAEFAADTLDVELGQQVGYQFKGESSKSESTKLLYATDGTIVSLLIKDPSLKEFDAVIIDEAHERKVQIDFLMYLLKSTLKLRPEFKLIIMSATVNDQIFADYYSESKFVTVNVGATTNYPIKSIFLDQDIGDNQYVKKGNDIISEIIRTDDPTTPAAHDILFFVTSVNETIDYCRSFVNSNTLCIEVYAGMSNQKQELAQDRNLYKNENTKLNRKLVLATNVAESSLTIDGIKFVIDSGYELLSYYDPVIRAKILSKSLISHAQAKQRMGRAGRTESGVCYHLYTKDTFNQMKRFPEPTILKSNIYAECLKLLNIPTINNVSKLTEVLNDFIEPPKKPYINIFVSQLRDLNLIGKDDAITKLGKIVADAKLDPMDALVMIVAHKLDCMKDVSLIISALETTKNNLSEIFRKPKLTGNINRQTYEKMLEQYKKKMTKLANKHGDHLTIYDVMNVYRTIKEDDKAKLHQWGVDNFIKTDVLDKINKNYHQLVKSSLDIFNKMDLNITVSDDIIKLDITNKILLCFMFGYRLNTAILKGNTYSTPQMPNVTVGNDSFINFINKKPENVIYTELFGMNRMMNLNVVSDAPSKLKDMMDDIKIE